MKLKANVDCDIFDIDQESYNQLMKILWNSYLAKFIIAEKGTWMFHLHHSSEFSV